MPDFDFDKSERFQQRIKPMADALVEACDEEGVSYQFSISYARRTEADANMLNFRTYVGAGGILQHADPVMVTCVLLQDNDLRKLFRAQLYDMANERLMSLLRAEADDVNEQTFRHYSAVVRTLFQLLGDLGVAVRKTGVAHIGMDMGAEDDYTVISSQDAAGRWTLLADALDALGEMPPYLAAQVEEVLKDTPDLGGDDGA